MARIIRQSWIEETVSFHLSYTLIGHHQGTGFSFPCDATGAVDEGALYPEGRESLAQCRAGIGSLVESPIVMEEARRYRHAAVLQCDCGREVTLDGFTCPCDCGRDYNASGSLLAPRSQWGEETGESLADILRIR